MIIEKKEENIRTILLNFAQMNHLDYFKDWNIKKRKKEDTIKALLSVISTDSQKYDEFIEWLKWFNIDGNNNYYIFNYNNLNLQHVLEKVSDIVLKDITDVNTNDIKETQIIYKDYCKEKGRIIIRYISPAIITTREITEGRFESIPQNSAYFANIFIDLQLEQIIISMQPTTGLVSVDGNEVHARNFGNIAEYYLQKLNGDIGNFDIIDCKDWIYDALDIFAEKGTSHNNPEITEQCKKHHKTIKDFATALIEASGIKSESSIENLTEDISILYETILVEEMGIIESADEYTVFHQNGDKVNSFFSVGSKTSNLREGREYAIAKTTRNISDLSLLGVMKKINGEIFKFLVEVENGNYYVIKGDTSKFIKEEVIYDVIRRVGGYKKICRQR